MLEIQAFWAHSERSLRWTTVLDIAMPDNIARQPGKSVDPKKTMNSPGN